MLRQADEGRPVETLMDALGSYQGELLPGFYDEWVLLEREQLLGVYERKIACLLEFLDQDRRWNETVEWAERWISFGQKPEAAYRYLMLAHAAQGDMAKAAAAFDRCERALAVFGVEPSEQTRRLYDDVRSGRLRLQTELAAPVSEPRKALPSTLPVSLTSFIGRQKEIWEVVRLVGEKRLVTLTGSGGVGKTRLAIEAARKLERKFKDGVCWIGLVGLSDPDLIGQEIAQVLHVREIPSETLLETVKSYLRSRELLLVIDNCEHLIRACADISEQLLAACPRIKILATSIEALGLFNEINWQVPSLPLPDRLRLPAPNELVGYESIQLFVERAANAKPGFAMTENNAPSVAKICQHLDGIPLAIELAAARIKVLTVEEIAARLDDRFSLLTSGSRTAIPRHQTLRATIDWSHELLSEPERILFRRLAVFSSSFNLEEVEAICEAGSLGPSDLLDSLGRLVDKSLVIADSDAYASETRYRLLETIRQYALEKLVGAGEAQSLRQEHAKYFLQFAGQAEPQIYGSNSPRWVHRLQHELDNVRAAMDWFMANGQADLALQMLGDLVYYWFAHGLIGSEWNDRLHDALARPEGQKPTLARAKALNGMSFMYWADITPMEQRSELEEALAIAEELGDPLNSAVVLRSLGLYENIHGNFAAARQDLRRSIALFRGLGPEGRMGMANSLIFLGDVAFNQREWAEAKSLFEEAAATLRASGDMNFLAYTVRRLGHIDWLEGDFKQARMRCGESLSLNREVGGPRGVLATLVGFAAIAVARSQYQRAATLMGAVDAQLALRKVNLLYIYRLEYARNRAELQKALDQKAFNRAMGKGQVMSLDEAIAFAAES